jgi:hypothetical protein
MKWEHSGGICIIVHHRFRFDILFQIPSDNLILIQSIKNHVQLCSMHDSIAMQKIVCSYVIVYSFATGVNTCKNRCTPIVNTVGSMIFDVKGNSCSVDM